MQIYVVSPGDNIDSIAIRTNVRVDTIIYYNQLTYPYQLAIGQALLLPDSQEDVGVYDSGDEQVDAGFYDSGNMQVETRLYEGENVRRATKRLVEVNGYAYPFIRTEVLNQTLPYLTDLSIFSYGFTRQGNLIRPWSDDTDMIMLAIDMGVSPVLTLTPLGEGGVFDNRLISELVNDVSRQQTLIEELLIEMNTKGFQGVDVDFEYILADDRQAFADFVTRLRQEMNNAGYSVSVALAPKTSDDQRGLLYEGKDYALLGEAADKVLLMTYEWGYTYGPPMAVAPINKVREVVEYAITRIPAEKISLGIPNYGYDWPLPFEMGVTKARTIGNIEAVQIAINQGAEIQFDALSQTPYFRYTSEGIMHEVWFEDVRSMKAKFDLVDEYRLRGMGYWQLMRLFLANWILLADQFYIA